MTTQTLTFHEFAPAVQENDRLGWVIRRVLKWSLILAGTLLTLWILSEAGPVVYGLPVPLMRQAARQRVTVDA
jgi:hypothetical protein